MLNRSTSLLALALCLSVAGALPATAWAQPNKPKPAAATQNDPGDEVKESPGAGKKVKTEGQKAEDGKTKPKPAVEDDETSPPGKPGTPATSGASGPPRDR